MANDKTKVTVALEVNIVLDVSDDGYLGVSETVAKHIKKAQDDARSWQFLVKRGALDPEPVQARVRVRSVAIIPEVT